MSSIASEEVVIRIRIPMPATLKWSIVFFYDEDLSLDGIQFLHLVFSEGT